MRQKRPKERSEPDGMPTDHNISFLHGSGKDEFAKVPHALQSIRFYWFVSGVKAHIDLVHKGGLKVSNLGFLVDPRGLNRSLGRGDGQRVGIAADFLQGRQD